MKIYINGKFYEKTRQRYPSLTTAFYTETVFSRGYAPMIISYSG